MMQEEVFNRLRDLYDGIGIVAALLSVIGLDAVNELPTDTVCSRTLT